MIYFGWKTLLLHSLTQPGHSFFFSLKMWVNSNILYRTSVPKVCSKLLGKECTQLFCSSNWTTHEPLCLGCCSAHDLNLKPHHFKHRNASILVWICFSALQLFTPETLPVILQLNTQFLVSLGQCPCIWSFLFCF